jgi:hypothetical protein
MGEGFAPDEGDDMANSNETEKRETATEGEAPTGCCGGAAPAGADACCALDAEVKSAGGSGCGCAPKADVTLAKRCC